VTLEPQRKAAPLPAGAQRRVAVPQVPAQAGIDPPGSRRSALRWVELRLVAAQRSSVSLSRTGSPLRSSM